MSECSSGSCSSGNCSGDADKLPPGILSVYDLNQQTGLGTLVWAETDGMGIHPAVIEILGKTKGLSEDRIFAMITGSREIKGLYGTLFEYGVDTIYHIRNEEMVTYRPEAYAEALADISERINPMCILIAGTPRGREVAPLTSAMLKTGLIADCIDISMDGGTLSGTRSVQNGNLNAVVTCKRMPQMATLRPGAFNPGEPEHGRKGTVISRPFRPKSVGEIISERPNGTPSPKKRISIAIGKDLCEDETVKIAERIASNVNAELICLNGSHGSPSAATDVCIAFDVSKGDKRILKAHTKRLVTVDSDRGTVVRTISDRSIVGNATEILRRLDVLLRQ